MKYHKGEFIMKTTLRRKFVGGIFALCLVLSVAGCGKSSEEKQAADYYQNELGLDKDMAEELAHELYGMGEEEPDVTEEVPKEAVVEPLPELVNSAWYECKVQICDMLFNCAHMTEEDIRKMVEGSAYDVELKEGFDENGDVCLTGFLVDGIWGVELKKVNYGSGGSDTGSFFDLQPYGEYELLNSGSYYTIDHFYNESREYDDDDWTCYQASIEFEDLDLKTRDDVLAYLSENGFVEVEKEQAPYEKHGIGRSSFIWPDDEGAEFADVPHYCCTGVQSINIYRIHKLGETDQMIEYGLNTYSGAHLNLVNCVTFSFDTDGTLASIDIGRGYEGDYLNPYILGKYPVDTREVEIIGKKID